MSDTSKIMLNETNLSVVDSFSKLSTAENSSEGETRLTKSLSMNAIKPTKTNEQTNGDLDYDKSVAEISKGYRSILENLGENTSRQGLERTPERAAKAIMFFTKGYRENITGIQSFNR